MSPVSCSGRIVVGVDGSPNSKLALSWAARMARTEHAGVDVLIAWEYPVSLGWSTFPVSYSPRREAQEAALAAIKDVFGDDPPADLRVITHEGNAAAALIEKSSTARMIIIGSRGRPGMRARLFGSLSARVAELAQCPVLVAHAPIVPDCVPLDIEAASNDPEIHS
jgi:nucleotide-binding universal stress UspA family protein